MKTFYSVNSSVNIRNANGTAVKKCKNCGSWIKHWKNISGEATGKCSVAGCDAKGTEGAHVVRPKANNEDYKTHPYILPMCKDHDGKYGESFQSKYNVIFVLADVEETCGK